MSSDRFRLTRRPEYVVRGDGTLVEIEASISPRQEFSEFLKLFKDWRMLALFPMFFSSNYCKFEPEPALKKPSRNGLTASLRLPGRHHCGPLQWSYPGSRLASHRSGITERRHYPRFPHRPTALQTEV